MFRIKIQRAGPSLFAFSPLCFIIVSIIPKVVWSWGCFLRVCVPLVYCFSNFLSLFFPWVLFFVFKNCDARRQDRQHLAQGGLLRLLLVQTQDKNLYVLSDKAWIKWFILFIWLQFLSTSSRNWWKVFFFFSGAAVVCAYA